MAQMNDVIIYLITIVHFLLSTTIISPIRDAATRATMALSVPMATICFSSTRT